MVIHRLNNVNLEKQILQKINEEYNAKLTHVIFKIIPITDFDSLYFPTIIHIKLISPTLRYILFQLSNNPRI